jgi:hypothetical protein
MSPPSDEARAILQRYREASAMPADRRLANARRLHERAAAGDVPAVDVTLEPAAGVLGRAGAWIVGGTLMAAVAGLTWATGGGVTSEHSGPAPASIARDEPERADEGTEPVEPSASAAPTKDGVRTPAPLEPRPGVDDATDFAPPPEPQRSSHKPPRDAPEASSLAAEVELLKRAQAAHNEGRHDAALRLLEQHRRRFPRGQMGEAREVARMLALCNLGREAELERARRRFARQHPRSAHMDRVRAICREP